MRRSPTRSRSPPRAPRETQFRMAHVYLWKVPRPIGISLEGVMHNQVKAHTEQTLQHRLERRETRGSNRGTLHEVYPNPPHERIQNFAAFLWEPLTDQRSRMVFVLVDIDIVPSAADTTHSRLSKTEAIYIKENSRRVDWLQEVGMGPFCRDETPMYECFVMARGNHWDTQDREERRHHNGDHFMIAMAHPEGEHFDRVWERTHGNRWVAREGECSQSSRDTPSSEESMDINTLMQINRRHNEDIQEEETSSLMTRQSHKRDTCRDSFVFREGNEEPIFIQTSEIPENDIRQFLESTLTDARQNAKYRTSSFYDVMPVEKWP